MIECGALALQGGGPAAASPCHPTIIEDLKNWRVTEE
jgi:hypothetical protein